MQEFHSPDRSYPTPCPNFDLKRVHYITRAKHTHEPLEMVYVTSGEALHTIYPADGSAPITQKVKRGNYYVILNGTHHAYHNGTADFTVINFMAHPHAIDERLSERSTPEEIERALLGDEKSSLHIPFNEVCFDIRMQLSSIFERIIEFKSKGTYGIFGLMRSYAIEILLMMLNQSNTAKHRPKSNIAEVLKEYINLHFAEQISLTGIAEQFFYATPYVSRRFKQTFHISFEDYLQYVRLKHACDLLLETDLSIEKISESVAYSTSIPFRRAFKKHFGMTPNEYRKTYGTSIQEPNLSIPEVSGSKVSDSEEIR